MSRFDPDFRHFASASGYRNSHTDHESKFAAFRAFAVDGKLPSITDPPFVIQFVCHPNFQPHSKTVTYYEFAPDNVGAAKMDELPSGYRRANSFKNYKSTTGHPKGLFYELNLYTMDGSSKHHTSRVTGSHYTRDDSHDKQHGTTKGAHWLSS